MRRGSINTTLASGGSTSVSSSTSSGSAVRTGSVALRHFGLRAKETVPSLPIPVIR